MNRKKTLIVLSSILVLALIGLGVSLKKDIFYKADAISTNETSVSNLPAIDGELLIKFKNDSSKEKKDKFYAKHNAKQKEKIGDLGIELISIETGKSPIAKAASIRRQDSDVLEFVEPNYQAKITAIPNDPYYSTSQWDFSTTGGEGGWEFVKDDSATILAITDTGIDLTHPDLSSKLIPGYDFYNNDSDPTDDNGHGTATAGVMAASSNNNVGVAGAMWTGKILPIKVCSGGGSCPYSTLAQGINYAASKGAVVVSISIGGSSSSSTLEAAVNDATSKGTTVVAASGNGDANGVGLPYVSYPGACANAIAVGASTQTKTRTGYSNYGSALDVMAPGYAYTTKRAGNYGSSGGTSIATPHVSGLVGLMKSLKSSLSTAQIKNYIYNNTDDIYTTGWDQETGWGIINYQKTLTAVNSGIIPTPTKGIITGKIYESGTSIPVAGAKIEAFQSNVLANNVTSLTDGSYSISLDPGTYNLTVSATGYSGQTKSVTVNSGSTTSNTDFTLVSNFTKSPPLSVGWNLISLPGTYQSTDPVVIFSGFNIDLGNLYKFVPSTQSMVIYDSYNPQDFGNVVSNHGYWFKVSAEDTGKQITYLGTALTTTQSIALPPMSGWIILGNPFDHSIDINTKLKFYEKKGKKYSFEEAINLGWINPMLSWFDSPTQSMKNASVASQYPESEELLPWHGYWMQVNKAGLTLDIAP